MSEARTSEKRSPAEIATVTTSALLLGFVIGFASARSCRAESHAGVDTFHIDKGFILFYCALDEDVPNAKEITSKEFAVNPAKPCHLTVENHTRGQILLRVPGGSSFTVSTEHSCRMYLNGPYQAVYGCG